MASRRFSVDYVLLLAAAFLAALAASWSSLGVQIDNNAYDWMFRVYNPPAWQPESILLAIDEASLASFGGVRGLRDELTDGLARIAAAHPKVVAIDVILSDASDPASDANLEAALQTVPNLVLACDLIPAGNGRDLRWETPLPSFSQYARAVGHVHGQPDELDAISRMVPLEQAAGRERHWALALEAFRLSRGADILETHKDLQVGATLIPAARVNSRLMRVRYIPPDRAPIPRVSIRQLHDNPSLAAQFAGKVVFVGLTAQTAVRDRFMTPYSTSMIVPGVEIHANAFETMAQAMFLIDAPQWLVILYSLAMVAAAGLAFALWTGWQANVLAAFILIAAHATPYLLFTHRIVFSLFTPVACAWLSIVIAAAYQHLVVRRRLVRSEAERGRYQQAMHFVTHEMRTPLTAIQGSSELIGRYAAMPEEKRKQIAQLINSESKRLGRMIEVFLNVERLSAGQMELKHETFVPWDVLIECVERARPLAARKQIEIMIGDASTASMTGDRELMEYAFYNLLTNAVKYSPMDTRITVYGNGDREHVRIAVRDQGIGMDKKEVRQIFQKFYRTKKAEESGEAGTGIGLSIVEQIVTQHGGRIEVESHPGRGSCFTLVVPTSVGPHVTITRS